MTTLRLELLLIEDEALIAMMAEDMIDGCGHAIAAVAATLTAALTAVHDASFDAALLDVNLNGEVSMAVADALKTRGKPFCFTTGYGAGGIDTKHRDVPILTKPYAFADLERVLDGFVVALTAEARSVADQRGNQVAGTSSITSVVDSNRG